MPTDSQFDREKDLFVQALEIPAGEERLRHLKDACGENAALFQRVQALLQAHEEAIGFLPKQRPGGDPSLIAALTEKPGDRIARYKLREKIGEGGCGVVYVADQEEPVRRRVALKIIKPGMDTRSVIARFEAERQALAMMDHPNIAKVLDVGTTQSGRPYFVMELVRGIKITDYCDQNHLPTAERLKLFVQICHAIQHAHQKGIIHRDLKPSNILVTLHDDVPVPKVIDFGIAKAIEGRLTDFTIYTELHQFIGTPAYTSPEQAQMSGLDIDTRADIYSLGVLLYELLTGQTPFNTTELLNRGLDEMRRVIREQEPPRPSTRLSTMMADELTTTAARRQTDAPKLISLLRGELDWLVMKCLEKNRARRYETANALATDVQHHLSNEPVVARPPSAAYRLQKLVRRNKLAFAAGAAVTAALLLGLAFSTWSSLRERAARQRAIAAEREQSRLRTEAETARAMEQQLRERAEAGEKNARYLAYVANINLAQQAWERNEMEALRRILEETKDYSDKGFEWYYWQRQAHPAIQTIFLADHDPWCMAFSPDGQRVATGGRTAKVRDTASGRIVVHTLAGYRGWISAVAFSLDGQRLAAANSRGLVQVWDTASGKELYSFDTHDQSFVAAVALSPDGHLVVTCGSDGLAKVWDAISGKSLGVLGDVGRVVEIAAVTFSPDGQRIVTCSEEDQIAKVWDVTSRKQLFTLKGHTAMIWSVAFSPDGRRILTGSADGTARTWDASTGQQLQTLIGHTVRAAVFSPDGRRIATSGADNTARVWDAASGRALHTFKGHGGIVQAVAFSPDGQRVLTASYDGTVKVWDASEDLLPVKWRQDETSQVKFSPDGRWIVTAHRSNYTASVWDAASGQQLLTLRGHADAIWDATFSSDSRRIVTGSKDKTAIVWDAATGRMLHTLKGHRGSVYAVAFSRDGQRIVTGSSDLTARVWDATSGQELNAFKGHGLIVRAVAFSPDGRRVVTGGSDLTARVWDATSGQELNAFKGHGRALRAVAFSPDGQRIASGGVDQAVRIWDASNGQELCVLRPHWRTVTDVAFSPDGRQIVTGSSDGTAKLWEATSGKELLTFTLEKDRGTVVSVAFSADGRRIFASASSSAAVFEAASPEQVAAWQKEEQAVAEAVAALERERKPFYEADSLHRKGNFAAAEPLYRQLLQNRRQRLPSNDPAVLETTADLACVLYSQTLAQRLDGEAAKAAESNREADELLNQLVAQIDPNDAARWRAVAEAFARRRHWKAAASFFARLVDGNPARAQDRLRLGLVLVETGDARGYEQLRQKALSEFADTDDPVSASAIARLGCLRPMPKADAAAAAALSEKAVTLGREHTSTNWFVFSKGLAEYRQGNFSSALESLQKIPIKPEYSPIVAAVQAVLAMARFHTNQTPEARTALARCAVLLKKYGLEAKRDDLFENWSEWLMVHLLQREATELIEGQPAPAPLAKPPP